MRPFIIIDIQNARVELFTSVLAFYKVYAPEYIDIYGLDEINEFKLKMLCEELLIEIAWDRKSAIELVIDDIEFFNKEPINNLIIQKGASVLHSIAKNSDWDKTIRHFSVFDEYSCKKPSNFLIN